MVVVEANTTSLLRISSNGIYSRHGAEYQFSVPEVGAVVMFQIRATYLFE